MECHFLLLAKYVHDEVCETSKKEVMRLLQSIHRHTNGVKQGFEGGMEKWFVRIDDRRFVARDF